MRSTKMVSKCFRKALRLFAKKGSMMKLTMYNNRFVSNYYWSCEVLPFIKLSLRADPNFLRGIISGQRCRFVTGICQACETGM